MTIGIAAYGPSAGLAVFAGLRAAELIGRGAIGGFVSYAAIDSGGCLRRHQTQRGGTHTLFIEGETTGTPPPAEVATARVAAVISSGPERPEPLAQFLAADAAGGLVTGHRLPNAPSIDGRPLNREVLEHLLAGAPARDAVSRVIDRNPEADVGLIAVDLHGGLYGCNSRRVCRRPDLGQARLEDEERGLAVEVLHNAIRPFPVLADTVAAVAFEVLRGEPQPDGWITIKVGVPVALGVENAVHCDRDLAAVRVTTTDPVLVRGRQVGAAVYLYSRVYRDDDFIGLTMFEPIMTVEEGRIVEMSGQKTIRMSYIAHRVEGDA